MQTDEPLCSGVRKAVTSPLSEKDNLLASDDDQTDWFFVDETYLPSSNIQFTGGSGISQVFTLKYSLPREFFKSLVTEKILKMIVIETNR